MARTGTSTKTRTRPKEPAAKKIVRVTRDWPDVPEYGHKVGEYLHLAPPEPLLHKCPDCLAEKAEVRLTYLRSLGETWGTVVTRHDVYRCRSCKTKWVSTNGREPDVAADEQVSGVGFTAARGDFVTVVVDGKRAYHLTF